MFLSCDLRYKIRAIAFVVLLPVTLTADDFSESGRQTSIGTSGSVPVVATAWTVEDVALWAANHAPVARLLEAERAAVSRGLDCKDDDQRAQVGLLQAVTRELALHSRHESAADATAVYYQIVGTIKRMEVLRQVAPRLENLEALAEDAQRLELPDGDIDKLTDRRLIMEDTWYRAEFGVRRLRAQISELVGKEGASFSQIELISDLPDSRGIDLDPQTHINVALQNRHDLKAIETLCKCSNDKSLPSSRALLGIIVPGLGLTAAITGDNGSLLGLCKDDDSEDLSCRKMQCQQLAAARRDQIAAQVRDALLQIEEAQLRLDVVRRRVDVKLAVAERTKRSVELEQNTPGSDILAELEWLEVRAEMVERRQALALALVALDRSKGTILK